jgi:hypothetical protein
VYGALRRAFWRGLLGGPGGTPAGPSPTGAAGQDWGNRIDATSLSDLYHPQEVTQFAAPPGGIDNLRLSSVDTFMIPGRGEYSVNFDGYFRIGRADPTTADWANAQVFVNMLDMNLTGSHPDLGQMNVRLNPNVVSAGQTFGPALTAGPATLTAPAACRIAAGATFQSSALGVTVFNKEPILLMNDAIESIPPVEDPNGIAHLYKLPLYDMGNPGGEPVAYLTSLRYTVGNYVTEADAIAYRAQ